MALGKAQLITDIKAISNTLKTWTGGAGQTQQDAINKFATDLAEAIDTFVKSGTVITSVSTVVASGIACSVNPGTHVGTTTGTGTGAGAGSGSVS